MKNLDLNSFGVQEMNANEMKKTDGGWRGVPYPLDYTFGEGLFCGQGGESFQSLDRKCMGWEFYVGFAIGKALDWNLSN